MSHLSGKILIPYPSENDHLHLTEQSVLFVLLAIIVLFINVF
jgi:hypothetical protein